MWQEIYDRLAGALDEEARRRIDELLEVRPGERKSALFLLKQYPPEAKPPAIAAQIARYHMVRSIGADWIEEAGVGPDVAESRHTLMLGVAACTRRSLLPAPPSRSP